MTISRVLIAAFFALAAGVAVENAKANHSCTTSGAGSAAGHPCTPVLLTPVR